MTQRLFGTIAAVGTARALLVKSLPVILTVFVIVAALAIKTGWDAKETRAIRAEAAAAEAKADVAEANAARLVALNERDLARAENIKFAEITKIQSAEVKRANAFAVAQADKMNAQSVDIAKANRNTAQVQAALRSQALVLENRLPADPRKEIETARNGLKETKGFDYAKIN